MITRKENFFQINSQRWFSDEKFFNSNLKGFTKNISWQNFHWTSWTLYPAIPITETKSNEIMNVHQRRLINHKQLSMNKTFQLIIYKIYILGSILSINLKDFHNFPISADFAMNTLWGICQGFSLRSTLFECC